MYVYDFLLVLPMENGKDIDNWVMEFTMTNDDLVK